jgi:hypothetical protein
MVLAAFRYAPTLSRFLKDLNAGSPPELTRLYLASYRYLPILPVLSLVAAIWALRGTETRLASALWVFCALVVTGLLLNAWMTEAFFQPLLQIIESIR